MAKDTKLSGGITPTVSTREPSDFDKFVASNIDKAIIGTPAGDGGVKPLDSGIGKSTSNGGNTMQMELPAGITAEQSIQIQAAMKAILNGVVLAPSQTAVAQPPRDMIVPETHNRMWNPMVQFAPTARLSDMEASVRPGAVNPNTIIANAPISTKLEPKVDCSPVLIDTYLLLKRLLDGRWFVPGAPTMEVESTLTRLKSEIENK